MPGGRNWLNTVPSLSASFIIAVVEIIKKDGYSKDPNHNIVVVPNEDDIIIRYLFVLKNQAHPSQALITTNIKFDDHYQGFMKSLNKRHAEERK